MGGRVSCLICTSIGGPSASSSPLSRCARRPLLQPLQWHAFCERARQLTEEVYPLLQAQLQRYEQQRAPWIASVTQRRTNAEAELQAVLALPAADQSALQPRTSQLLDRVVMYTNWLNLEIRFVDRIASVIVKARAATAEQPAVRHVRLVTACCRGLIDLRVYPWPGQQAQGNGLRGWMLRLDSMLSQFASSMPLLALTSDECDMLAYVAIHTGALQLIPPLMKQRRSQTGRDDLAAFFLWFTLRDKHVVSLQPYLRLFEFGLDPATINTKVSSLSALQRARNWICDHHASAEDAAEAALEPAAAALRAESGPADAKPIPSVLAAWATQHQEATKEAENQRRAELHAAFMHALLPAWLSHSTKVLALLSSPSVLIPDLAVIVGRYLDLEGLPVEPLESVNEDAEDAQSAE